MDAEVGGPSIAPPPTRSTLLSTYWRDPEYLAHVPLTPATALDYFSRSDFFDPASTNEMLRMQNIANPDAAVAMFGAGGAGAAGAAGRTARQQEEELSRFVGIEFVLVYAKQNKTKEAGGLATASQGQPQQPPAPGGEETLFVIQKRRRDSPIRTTVLETYYILNGNIHMAPDLDTVLNNRMVTALHSLRSALTLARDVSGRPLLPATTKVAKNGTGVGGGDAGEKGKKSTTTTITGTSTNKSGTGGATTLGAEATAHSARLAREQAQVVGSGGTIDEEEEEEEEEEEGQDVEMLED